MPDGCHFEELLNRHISSTVWPILMKFGMVMQIGPLQRTETIEILNFWKNQDGGGRHLEKLQKSRYIRNRFTDFDEIYKSVYSPIPSHGSVSDSWYLLCYTHTLTYLFTYLDIFWCVSKHKAASLYDTTWYDKLTALWVNSSRSRVETLVRVGTDGHTVGLPLIHDWRPFFSSWMVLCCRSPMPTTIQSPLLVLDSRAMAEVSFELQTLQVRYVHFHLAPAVLQFLCN